MNQDSKVSEAGQIALRTNLQRAQTKRALQLMNEGRDYDKRANGTNATLPGALVGDMDPTRLLSRETPVHRQMINMMAAGYQVKEIADFTGCCVATVSNVLKQPWAREYLINEAKKTVQDEIKQLLENEAIPSLKRLVSVRDSETARPADVISASNSLLDRFLGKPVQPMTNDAKPVAQMSDEELRQQVQDELNRAKAN